MSIVNEAVNGNSTALQGGQFRQKDTSFRS